MKIGQILIKSTSCK